jgi:predicted transcriptional regulator
MKRIAVEVLSSGEALGRVARAWSAARKGGKTEPTIGVSSIGELSALLSPRRMELLRFVAENGGLSVRALAKQLDRDYKNVHSDVAALEARHLLERDEAGGIVSPYDEIVIRAPLRDAA